MDRQALNALFEQGNKDAKAALERNKGAPKVRPAKNRDEAILAWKLQYGVKTNKKTGYAQVKIVQTIVSGQSHSSYAPNDALGLKPITLRNMQVPMVHIGAFIVCRTIVDSEITVGTHVLIEDQNGDVEDLSLYGFNADMFKSNWLPKGTILLLKEPCMKYASIGSDKVIIRMDSPSDVIFVDETDQKMLENIGVLDWYVQRSNSFDLLKSKGNECFKRRDFLGALKFYNQALRIEPNSAVIQMNKAAVYLEEGRFFEAYEAVNEALNNGADKEKAVRRLGKAAYGMRNWEQALHHFETLCNEFPNAEYKAELQRVKDRIGESKSGVYDIREIYNRAYKRGERRLDIADYVGPVAISDVADKGKGLIAKRNICKGTLLLASKAFSIAFVDELEGMLLLSHNLITDRHAGQSALLNIGRVMQELRKNPQRSAELYALYAGNIPRGDRQVPNGVIDAARIENICTFNSFSPINVFNVPKYEEYMAKEAAGTVDILDEQPAGLWLLPSFANHLCIQNATCNFFGDFVMIHAIFDIKKGQEVTLNYGMKGPLSVRLEKMKAYGFVCTCPLCEFDRSSKFKAGESAKMMERAELAECMQWGKLRDEIFPSAGR